MKGVTVITNLVKLKIAKPPKNGSKIPNQAERILLERILDCTNEALKYAALNDPAYDVLVEDRKILLKELVEKLTRGAK